MKHPVPTICLISLLLLFFLSGCTEVPNIPYTTSQFITKSTDLNYNLYKTGVYDKMILLIDGNKISVADKNELNVVVVPDTTPYFDYIDFNLLSGFDQEEGRLQWNADDGTLELGMPGGVVNLQIGQEHIIRVRNESGKDINNGNVVFISGGIGNKALITLADNNSLSTATAIGLATENIKHNSYGYVTTEGLVRNVNTDSLTNGTILWLASNGQYSATRPEAPKINVVIGQVIKGHSNEGIIYAKIDLVPRLVGLSDVNSTGLLNGQVLYWDSISSTWKTKTLIDLDTNWQTSWTTLDANLKATFYTKTQSDANWNKYLPLTGGTMTGNLNVWGKIDSNKTPAFQPTFLSNMVLNGTFDSALTNWTSGVSGNINWVQNNGTARMNIMTGNTSKVLYQVLTFVEGNYYILKFDKNGSAGTTLWSYILGVVNTVGSNGHYEFVFRANGTHSTLGDIVGFEGHGNNGDFISVDNVEVSAITPYSSIVPIDVNVPIHANTMSIGLNSAFPSGYLNVDTRGNLYVENSVYTDNLYVTNAPTFSGGISTNYIEMPSTNGESYIKQDQWDTYTYNACSREEQDFGVWQNWEGALVYDTVDTSCSAFSDNTSHWAFNTAPINEALLYVPGAVKATDLHLTGNITVDGNVNAKTFLGDLKGSAIDTNGLKFLGEANGNKLDYSGNGNSMVFVNQTTYAEGRYGQAYSFDGNNDYAYTPAAATASNGTVAFWLYPRNLTAGGTYRFVTHPYPNRIYFEVSAGGVFQSAWDSLNTTVPFNHTLDVNRWTHVALTWNGTSVATYVNGVKTNTGTINALAGASSNFYLGSYYGTSQFTNCAIDEFMVYDRTLSENELRDIYLNMPNKNYDLNVGGSKGNLNIDNNGHLTLVGEATVWEDVYVPLASTKLAGVNDPDFTGWKGANGTRVYEFQDNIVAQQDEVFFTFQMPHAYKLNSSFDAHLHWTPDSSNTGNARFSLSCDNASINGTFSNVYAVVDLNAISDFSNTNKMTDFNNSYSCSTVSCIMQCRLVRLSADALDTYVSGTYVHAIDFHVEMDSLGSNGETIK